jgi:hypothetical protein
MHANVTQRFGCVDCAYFTNTKCNINRHVLSKAHLNKMANPTQESKSKRKKKANPLEDQIASLTILVSELTKNQKSVTNVVNSIVNTNNTINNNYNIFLNEKCGNAVEFKDFIKGMDFCREDFEAGNLLKASAAEYTASIFANHLNKMTLYERPIHSFVGEDPNQLIAHYRHNNEWKRQSEIMILDEVYRDFDGDEPKDSFMYHIGNFHKRRREHFDMYHGGKKNHVSPNLNFTTYCEQQIDLVRKLLEMVSVSPTSGDGSEYLQVCEKTTLC